MIAFAVLALVASVLVWAAPSSQAQANQAPFADAGSDQTVNPGTSVTLTGVGSIDVDAGSTGDCGGCEFEWEIETGPYDWISIGEDSATATDDTATAGAAFEVPSEAFVDKVADSDPQKYEIVVRLTVTDDDGATDTDTVSININQRPVADIQVYAGLRDRTITDGDLGEMGHFPVDAVIDGPGENGNRDNEWDIMEGAWLQLDGSGSTDENPSTGKPSAYQWTRVRPTGALDGYAESQTAASATGQRLEVAEANSAADNVTTITFVGVDADEDDADDTLVVNTLPDVMPRQPQTVFYQLTVCDSSPAVAADITTAANCTNGRTGAALIRIVVHDTSAAPTVQIEADLTSASDARGDAEPQSTVGEFSGVENQFLVAAGSSVRLIALVRDRDQSSGHTFRWSGATPGSDRSRAVVRVPDDAEDGETIDVTVTVTDNTGISVTTPIQLLVGDNTAPTAGGVPANEGAIMAGGRPILHVHSITDGFQSRKDGSTVTLRGVANDADGGAPFTAWSLRDAPAPLVEATAYNGATKSLGCDTDATTAFTATPDVAGTVVDANASLLANVEAWLDAADDTAKTAAAGAATALIGCILANTSEAADPLFELSGALTDTVSFDVPNLENGENAGTLLLFTAVDSNNVAAAQFVYIHISADDDAPNANAGADAQVDPEAFVRLNGSASSDPDVGDKISYSWEYVGATMDPAPDERSPLSADEIDELDGWILKKDATATGGFTYIVKSDGTRADGVADGDFGKLQSTTSAYPYFDAPDLTGFNNIELTFRLKVSDTGGTDLNGDGTIDATAVDDLDETELGFDLNGDGDALDEDVDGVVEDTTNGNDYAMVVITVVNRYFSGNIPGPGYCYGVSLGGPQTYPFDSDKDNVADTCSLNTTRRATVARQNALETLANLNTVEFRNAVNAACNAPGFKQRSYGDDPADLDGDVCETGRVTPPPAEVDAADADVFYSGPLITGPDFCTDHSLGGARAYAHDTDGDEVADICSLSTTKREAIARQQGLETFIVAFSPDEQTRLTEQRRLVELEDADPAPTGDDLGELNGLRAKYGAEDRTADTELTEAERAEVDASIEALADKKADADRYSNALAAACRALGTRDFGDAPSALARDLCVTDPTTGRPLG